MTDQLNRLDHDLLVRIDERLTIHLAAFTHFSLESVRDRINLAVRVEALEAIEKERIGASRSNARLVALVIASAASVTSVATWGLGRLLH